MLETRSDFVDLARSLLPAVHEAGIRLMQHFRAGVEIERKADASPVSVADRDAEGVILAALDGLDVGIPVVAEEEVSEGRIPVVGTDLFLVDALDGTRGFVKGRDEFTVNVGLVIGRKAVFGIVYAPANGQMFVTLGPDEAIEIAVPAVHWSGGLLDLPQRRVVSRSAETRPFTVATSRYVSKRLDRKLSRLPDHRRLQTDSSIKFCLVARGDADLYPRFSEINEWDTAAGVSLLQAAGGCISSPTGESISYGNSANAFRHESGFIAWAEAVRMDVIELLRD